jgi:class 3 adenylate cyclase
MFRRRVVHSASEERLQKLVAARLEPAADRDSIDRHIWDLVGEEWCIMATDLAGFSRDVAQFGIIHFLQTIHEAERILVPVIESHDGILMKVEGDSLLVIFRNVGKAIGAAIEMQRATHAYNQRRTPEEQILLCIGLGFGKVLRIGDADVFGAEVNAASKLGEDMAAAHEILVTGAVRDAAAGLEIGSFEELDHNPPGAERAYRLHYAL